MQETPRVVLRTLGRRLIALRRSRGLTQEQFAEQLGLDVRVLRRIEAGTVDVRVSSLCRLARRLVVPTYSLLEPVEPATLREPRRPGRPRVDRVAAEARELRPPKRGRKPKPAHRSR